MAQFRAGILPLEIEVGRYRNVPLSERICRMCNSGQVEDDYHFLCVCERYNDDRRILYEKARIFESNFVRMVSFEQFVFLNIYL